MTASESGAPNLCTDRSLLIGWQLECLLRSDWSARRVRALPARPAAQPQSSQPRSQPPRLRVRKEKPVKQSATVFKHWHLLTALLLPGCCCCCGAFPLRSRCGRFAAATSRRAWNAASSSTFSAISDCGAEGGWGQSRRRRVLRFSTHPESIIPQRPAPTLRRFRSNQSPPPSSSSPNTFSPFVPPQPLFFPPLLPPTPPLTPSPARPLTLACLTAVATPLSRMTCVPRGSRRSERGTLILQRDTRHISRIVSPFRPAGQTTLMTHSTATHEAMNAALIIRVTHSSNSR